MAITINKKVFQCEICGMEFKTEELADLCGKRNKVMGKWYKRIYDIIKNTEESLKRELTKDERKQIFVNFCKGFADGLIASEAPLEKILLVKNIYFKLKIPTEKLVLEHMTKSTFTGFSFFLRKIENNGKIIQVITLHDYPNAIKTTVRIPSDEKFFISPDKSEKFTLSGEDIKKLLSQGFEWYHESEMSTLW